MPILERGFLTPRVKLWPDRRENTEGVIGILFKWGYRFLLRSSIQL